MIEKKLKQNQTLTFFFKADSKVLPSQVSYILFNTYNYVKLYRPNLAHADPSNYITQKFGILQV